MSSARLEKPLTLETTFERLQAASEILGKEAQILQHLAKNVPLGLAEAVECLTMCTGAVIVTGMGKAGWIGQKISASLASTGTRSHFLHPAEAVHGDLGRIAKDDWVLALSNSGETAELTLILPNLKRNAAGIISITAHAESTLGRASDVVIDFGSIQEACHLGLAPSTSTTAMVALGDALALVLSRARQFDVMDFAQFHPGGSLGKKLSNVEDIMRSLEKCRVARETERVRDIYVRSSVSQRRVGVILVVDADHKLSGIFTDSDLARLLERRNESALDGNIGQVMTRNPISISAGQRAEEAVKILSARNISELPVVDDAQRPLGIIDITDVISMFPIKASS
ncbi:MAG: KpsF/GutQ family sugar-phosphate isomerase [Pirellulaceae bacterium]